MGGQDEKPFVMQILYGGLGGHGSVAFSLVRGDVESTLRHGMLFFGIEEARKEYLEQCDELGLVCCSIQKRRGPDISAWRQVWRSLRRCGPDVLVVHSMTLVPLILAYQRESGCKVVFVDHQANAAKEPKEWLATIMASLLGNQLVVLTDLYAQELKSKLGPLYRSSRVVVINNGIDVDFYSPGPPGRHGEALVISMQARFSDTKDQLTLIRAFDQLRGLFPEQPLRLALAGDGVGWDDAQDLVQSLKLEFLVDMPGMLGESDLLELLRNTDIYVHSSLGETMSTAVMQAMAVGLPVIGTDISGINNMIDDGRTGLLFPAGDVDALVSRLSRLVKGRQARSELGARARRHAEEHFSCTRMFDEYASLCLD